MSNELNRYTQDPLFGEKSMSADEKILEIGMNASEVIGRIFDFYQIAQFSYTQYDPESTYPSEEDQPFLWNSWSGIDEIERISTKVFNDSIQKFKMEGTAINIHNILAIGSKIIIGEDRKQLQMLDFNFSEGEVDMDHIKNVGLSLLKDAHLLFGSEYLKLCLKRDYSALRIFGYEGTSKEKTPVVVAKI